MKVQVNDNKPTLPLMHGHGSLAINNVDKDGGMTLAAVIAALGALAKLMDQISGNAADLENLIRKMSSNIQDIRNSVARIEKFLDRLPLIIDQTVEAKFSQFVDNRLRALIQMYLEVKASLINMDAIPPETSSRLAFIHNEISTESRVIMGYGVSAASVLAVTISIEDDCAGLLKYSNSFRRESIRTLADFFSRMLTGHSEKPTPDSIDGYLQSLSDLLVKLDSYISFLDKKFSKSERAWSSAWQCTISGYKNDHVRTCRRVNYVATVVGSSKETYSYQETSAAESYTEILNERLTSEAKDASDTVVHDNFLVADPELFRENLIAQRSDVEYANSILRFRAELLETKKDIENLRAIYSSALSRANARIAAL